MAITLRIVGIFYKTEVTLQGNSGTVKDVLDAAQSQITTGDSFSYGVTRMGDYESPNVFRCFKESSFISHASKIEYSSGAYVLEENLSARPVYTVWQYYIFDAQGRFINRDKGFVPYDSPKALVEDGQSVTWRLVSVVAQPSETTPPRLTSAVAATAPANG